jgi:hypothetical protein
MLDLGDTYAEYEGEFTCWVCHTPMRVAFARGKLLAMTLADASSVIKISDDGKRMAITTNDPQTAANVVEAINSAR